MTRLYKTLMFCCLIYSINCFISGCGSPNESPETSSDVKVEKTLEDRLNYDTDISEFLPANIKKHDDISEFLSSYVRVGDKFYNSMYRNLNNQADLEGAVSDMEEDKGKDLIKSFKTTYKALKQTRKSSIGVLKTAWSGKDLIALEDKRKELKAKYSEKVLDSFSFVEKAIDKYLYYSYTSPVHDELDKIKRKGSIRTMPVTFTKDHARELGISNSLDKFISLQKAGNDVRKLLVFNNLKGSDLNDMVKRQIDAASKFWSNDEDEYKSKSKLFDPFTIELQELKRDLKEKREILKKNESDWSAAAVADLETVLKRYDEEVINEIARLNIGELQQPKWSIFKEAKETSTK